MDPKLVEIGEKAELETFKKMGFYEYVPRSVAKNDSGKTVNAKWVRINKGSEEIAEVRCHLVAQELGFGERLDELFAGTPSLTIVKLLRSMAAEKRLSAMSLDVTCAFLYGNMPRRLCFGPPRQDLRFVDGLTMGQLEKAMHGRTPSRIIWWVLGSMPSNFTLQCTGNLSVK